MTTEKRGRVACAQELSTSYRSHSVKTPCSGRSALVWKRVQRKGICNVTNQYLFKLSNLAGRLCKTKLQIPQLVESLYGEEVAKQVTGDLSMLYPQSVLKSSDPIGWQNVRAIHFRHNSGDMVIPASDDQCVMLNLGAPLFININPGKRRFEGKILSSEVAIIPAGSSWTCGSDTS